MAAAAASSSAPSSIPTRPASGPSSVRFIRAWGKRKAAASARMAVVRAEADGERAAAVQDHGDHGPGNGAATGRRAGHWPRRRGARFQHTGAIAAVLPVLGVLLYFYLR